MLNGHLKAAKYIKVGNQKYFIHNERAIIVFEIQIFMTSLFDFVVRCLQCSFNVQSNAISATFKSLKLYMNSFLFFFVSRLSGNRTLHSTEIQMGFFIDFFFLPYRLRFE